MENLEPERLSRKLLEREREGKNTAPIREKLESLSRDQLEAALDSDRKKKAFWLNIYNAYVQVLLRQKPSRYRFRTVFFMRRYVKIAGKKMSLNKIEHGMLRGSKLSFAFGYLKNPFALSFERNLRVENEDSRIHFALNCGAKTCPPIKSYRSEDIDQQLELATENYLSQEIKVHEDKIEVPKIFFWFRGDFGGKKGLKEFLSTHGFENPDKSIRYKSWDWEMDLKDFEK